MRLKDIRRRIEAGASIEAIGELIQSTQTPPPDKERASQADRRPND
jgi:hypothetical protein